MKDLNPVRRWSDQLIWDSGLAKIEIPIIFGIL